MKYLHLSGRAIMIVIAAAVMFGLPLFAALAAAEGGTSGSKASIALIDRVYEQGSVPVIVRLGDKNLPYGVFADGSQARSEVVDGLQSAVLDDVYAQTGRSARDMQARRFQLIPAMALQVDPDELEALLAHPAVIDIIEDEVMTAALDESVPLIGGAPDGSFSGYTGAGQVVAVLDTGVDKYHPFLSGKVVSEACYSHDIPTSGVSSLCPGGATESTEPGSGLNCDDSITFCNHGTIVAGIAAGRGDEFSGVAKDASLIAIQVFSSFSDGCGTVPAPCAKAYTSDVISGLERVYALRTTYDIAAVNLSLGGGSYESACDESSYKPIIDSLRAAGIATAIASGNGGETNAMCSPACVSSSVSVGNSTKSDTVATSSNSADFLSLLAPGTSITTSSPGGGYGTGSGTSLAAPHVAGAWAVMKQAHPGAGVGEILAALQGTGVPVVDTRDGAGNRVTPRIQVDAALSVMTSCEDDDDCGGAQPYCVAGTCVECLGDGDCDDFCVDGTCVECRSGSDCGDGLYCNGPEVCSGGTCGAGTYPCGGATPVCIEATDRCVECTNTAHCGEGYTCQANVCVGDCDLQIKYKPLTAAKLVKKAKKMKLQITGGEGFDAYSPVSVGPFRIIKSKPKVKWKKGVLKKNELKLIVLVPAGTQPGTFQVNMGPCSGTIQIL